MLLKLTRTFAIVFLAALPVAAAACRSAESTATAATPPSPEHLIDVPALTVGVADLESALEISGSLIPDTRVGIMARVAGTLSSVSVQLGDRVRAGQTVAVLDRREIDAQVDAAAAAVNVAHAGVAAAEAALENATLERGRAQNLFDKGAVPRQRFDFAETTSRAAAAQRDLAVANVAQAEATLRRAREIQRDATLTSPIDGAVVERNYDAGSLVSPSEKPVVVVADLRVLKLQAGVSELDAGRLHTGMPARVTVQARPGEVFDGRLSAIAPEVDAKNRHFQIEIRTSNPKNTLLSGMYGVATIPLARASRTIAIPRDAIATRAGARIVMKIDRDTVRESPVTEGVTNGALVQIVSGLGPGDVIVADARREVTAGAKVKPVFIQ